MTAGADDSTTARRFNIVVSGQTVSALGDAFANVAMPLLVLRTTGSVTQMGVVAGLSTGAQLAGGIIAGPVVDRLDRRRLLLMCDWAQMVLGASIPVAWWLLPAAERPHSGMALIYAVVVASSLFISVSAVGLRAAVPQLVGRHRLVAANGRLTMATEVAYGCGPAVAGLAIAALGEPSAIAANALTYGLSAAAWHLVRLRNIAGGSGGKGSAETTLSGRLTGLTFLRRDNIQRDLAVLEVLNALLVGGTTVLFIYYVRTEFDAGSTQVGILLSLASIGAVLAALAAPRLRSVAGVGRGWLIGVAVEGAALAAVGLTSSLWGVAVLAVVFAFGQVTAIILATSYRQERTPDRLLGRVSAAVLTALLAARAIGSLMSTWAAGRFSVRDVFMVIGGLVLLVVLVGCFSPLRRSLPVREQQPA